MSALTCARTHFANPSRASVTVAASSFPLGALTFFILLWIINVPLQVWNVFAVWQAANEFGKAPEGKATVQGQA